ncbi:thiamine pyrophosphate-binding protein [Allopusillimonas ginsengisoli]|uniref:thiamine pyrophosphate-binding protein n=1 Tax=Allopusillimonas ginsengisoli TaxID=453575 RepID=UPI00101F2E9F|nr:thiamine pyrophosphate-binding protein [Allopusillimonas ginsengisoli]TEA78783.1 thiamine pyrophosphate-binding protein [Allopusillimonas ginsengisoli]
MNAVSDTPISVTTKRAIVETLVELKVDYAFTLPGLGVTWMLDEFYETRQQLRVVLARSEQVASIMAQVVGRLTGKPGVYMGQGPFASTTGAFGILEAYFAGSPMLVLTDTSCYDGFGMYGVYQTMTGDYGAADVRTVMKTMTKSTYYATEPHEAVFAIQQAYKQANLPRQGPTAVVLKSPIIRREMPEQSRVQLYPAQGYQHVAMPKPDPQAIKSLARMVAHAERPVLIVGNGMQNARGRTLIAKLADRFGLAVATSYNAKGVVDETSQISVGMLGTWGMKSANVAVKEADTLVVIGASLGADYIKFRDPEFIKPGIQQIAQVDIDARNAGWVYPVDLAVCAEGGDVVEALLQHDLGADRRQERLDWIAGLQAAHPVFDGSPGSAEGMVNNADVVRVLDAFLTPDDLLTLDAGTNRIWATTTLKVRTPGQLIVPGGIGGMGWGAPAAAAAKLVNPEKNVVCLTGDGGFAMTMNVMATCVQENLPITVVVANNSGLGMVRDNLKTRRIAVDFSPTDFAQIAQGMGCRGIRVTTPEQLSAALNEARSATVPTVIDVVVDPESSHIETSDY